MLLLASGASLTFAETGWMFPPAFPSRLLKKALGNRLPHGRGSVSTCKQAILILSRAREQADFGLFQHPASA